MADNDLNVHMDWTFSGPGVTRRLEKDFAERMMLHFDEWVGALVELDIARAKREAGIDD